MRKTPRHPCLSATTEHTTTTTTNTNTTCKSSNTAAPMAPRVSLRTYGSVEDLAKARAVSPSATSASNVSPSRRQGPEVDPLYAVTEKTPTPRRWVRLAVVCGLAVGAVAGVVRSGYSSPRTSTANSSARSFVEVSGGQPEAAAASDGEAALPPLSFTANNFYHLRDGKPGLDYPWLKNVKLVEPHRETTLLVENRREGFSYLWEVRAGSSTDDVHTVATGHEVIMLFPHLEENMITLLEVDESGTVSRRLDEVVMVKYVRREIRTLTDDEREELLDAMFELWAVRVTDGNGREIYGDKYSDIWAINRLHFKAASPRFCDHFHDGLGFLTNHALLASTFEASLQQVNPKLTLPYWDFTIETSSAGEVLESGSKTPLLQPSWFGGSDPADNMVKDGRWAYTPIPRMVPNNPSGIEPDVYSKLRAAWNVNDRAYLTRGMGKMCGLDSEEDFPWPTCEMHYNLATSYRDFFSWVWGSMYDPHGPVHIWIGGVMDCADTYGKRITDLVGKETARNLASFSFIHRKDLFRSKFFTCEGSVDVSEHAGEVFSNGVCGCLGYDLTQGDDYLEIFNSMAMMKEYMTGTDDDTKREIVSILCSTAVNDGDHIQASSSLDPTFWSIHPTMERLWMFSVLSGSVTDFSWPDNDVTYTASDGTTYAESISLYSEECVGHRGKDVFPFGLLEADVNDFTVQTGIKGNVPGGGNVFTNREVLAAFDPKINALPYVYDTFKWTHCEADGFNMDDAWAAGGGAGPNARAPAGNPDGGGAQRTGVQSGGAAQDRKTAGGRTIIDKDAPRYPRYASLKSKMANLKKRNDA